MTKKLIDLLSILDQEPLVLVQQHQNRGQERWWNCYRLVPIEVPEVTNPRLVSKEQFYKELENSNNIGVICARVRSFNHLKYRVWNFSIGTQEYSWIWI